MKGGILRNSCLAQESKGRKRKLLYPNPKLSPALVPYRHRLFNQIIQNYVRMYVYVYTLMPKRQVHVRKRHTYPVICSIFLRLECFTFFSVFHEKAIHATDFVMQSFIICMFTKFLIEKNVLCFIYSLNLHDLQKHLKYTPTDQMQQQQ